MYSPAMPERLLERIHNLEDKRPADGTTAVKSEINSIIQHLVRLLNTRQGSVSIAEDYGVPDMTNVPGNTILESKNRIEETLRDVILRYEPRLKNIKLLMEEEDAMKFALKFRLEGRLTVREDIPVIFETVVSTDGKINVSY